MNIGIDPISLNESKTIFNKVIMITTAILISWLLLMSVIIATERHQAYARCPNGTHKSPSGDCEPVVKSSTKLPRCPNGTHRSPDGDCENVASSSLSPPEGITSSETTSTTSGSQSENNNSNNPSLLPTNPTITATNTSTSGVQCDQSLWNHVYNPSRLQVVEPCKTVSGIIESKRVEADGDYHIRLKLDPEFANLVNAANVKGQFGDLVLEPICMNRVTQLDAISACQNFHQNIDIPAIGSHVQVTGSYVLDKEHGKWAEIHPVTSIIQIP
jgi:hypothetical protein